MPRTLALLLALTAFAAPAAGVLIASGDGSENTIAPTDDPGWHDVGLMGSLNAVYLGRGWVLTARHVAQVTGMFAPDREPKVRLGGDVFPVTRGSGVELRNPDGSRADLLLLRIEGAPNLPVMPIATQSPPQGTPVVLIGRGRSRAPEPSYWDERFEPATGEGHRYAGFAWAGDAKLVKRWGTNLVARSGTYAQDGSVTHAIATVFDENGTAHEAQATRGDSGGAVFAHMGGRWVLAGIMVGVAEYPGQPARTAVFGNITFSADLSRYRDQIRAAVEGAAPEGDPEP